MDPQPAQQVSPEIQGLFAEAMFWKQKYLEHVQHADQVIAMLARPMASPEQLANVVQLRGNPEEKAAEK